MGDISWGYHQLAMVLQKIPGKTLHSPKMSIFLDHFPWKIGTSPIWVCLKIEYIPNYSHLIGIMISKTIGFRGTLFSDKPKWQQALQRISTSEFESLRPTIGSRLARFMPNLGET
jgi:hypothetical protein